MNTLEIKQKLEENKHTKAIFQNVYAVDQLPREKIRQDRWLLVVNCCPIKRKGEHWICIYGDKDAGIDFFDSLDSHPWNTKRKSHSSFIVKVILELTLNLMPHVFKTLTRMLVDIFV